MTEHNRPSLGPSFRLLICLLVWVLTCVACSWEPDYKSFEERLFAALGHEDELKILRDDLTNALAHNPNDERLIRARTSVNQSLNDLDAVEEDMKLLASIPGHLFYRFSYCQFMEIRYGYSEAAVKCYADILPEYEKYWQPEEPAFRYAYVFNALMAEAPNAQALREDYLREAGDAPEVWFYKRVIEHFDRRYFTGKANPPPEWWPENLPPHELAPPARQSVCYDEENIRRAFSDWPDMLVPPLSRPQAPAAGGEYEIFTASVMEQIARKNIPAAVSLLDQILALHPEAAQALELRGALLLALGKGEDAFKDMERLLEKEPGNPKFLLNACLYREIMGEDADALRACYAKAARNIGKGRSPDALCGDSFHVLAAILAGLPEAQRFHECFPNTAGSPETRRAREEVVNFDRSLLRNVFGSWRNNAQQGR